MSCICLPLWHLSLTAQILVMSLTCSYCWWYHRQCSLITSWNLNNVYISDSQVHPDTLLHWLKKQVALYDNLHVEDVTHSFKNGLVLCAIIHRYRPDLLDFHTLSAEDIAANNQLAFDTLERELGIPPVSSAVLCVIYGNFLHWINGGRCWKVGIVLKCFAHILNKLYLHP